MGVGIKEADALGRAGLFLLERTNAWLGQFRRLLVAMSICSPPTTPSSTLPASGLR